MNGISTRTNQTSIIVAVFTGIIVLLAGSLPWGAVLAPANLRFATLAPWAILPMAVYLWCYWRYIGGNWGPESTAVERRTSLRANAVSAEIWILSIFAGLLGFGAVFSMLGLMSRLVKLPASEPVTTPPGMPSITAFMLLVMSSIVAGVTEEAAFRGYMQGPVERQYGLIPAVLVNGAVFGLLHFPNHPGDVWTMLPYYIVVSGVYGGMTWASNSILPALVLHSGGDVWSLGRLWLTGRPEWQLSPQPAALVWQTGLDAGFLISAAVSTALAGLTVVVFLRIHGLRDSEGG